MRRGLLALGLSLGLLATLLLSGCGAASEDYEVAGIDGLTIPTPSPDPEDFVGYVDNPWFPLEQGNEWTYDVDDGVQGGRTTVTVEPSNLRLGGVAVTVLRSETLVGKGPSIVTTDYYAQDRDGNVWWFGRQGEWDVEVAGAEAGLAMPADPRVGDGWRLALLEGVVEERATVDRVEDGVVVLRVEDALAPGDAVEREYAADIGLVRTFNLEGPPGSSELSSGP